MLVRSSLVSQHLNEGGRFYLDVHSIYQIDERFFQAGSYHENAETFAIRDYGWTNHSIVHELTFLLSKMRMGVSRAMMRCMRSGPSRFLTYDILLEHGFF